MANEKKMKLTNVLKQQVEYLQKELKVSVCDDGIEVESYTDAGGDMVDFFHDYEINLEEVVNGRKKKRTNLKALMLEYYNDYDINHEVAIWWPNGETGRGVPFNDMSEHFADLKAWRKEMVKFVKAMPNDDGTIPEPEEEEEQVVVKITADSGCLKDFLQDLIKHIQNEGEDFGDFETCIGSAEREK